MGAPLDGRLSSYRVVVIRSKHADNGWELRYPNTGNNIRFYKMGGIISGYRAQRSNLGRAESPTLMCQIYVAALLEFHTIQPNQKLPDQNPAHIVSSNIVGSSVRMSTQIGYMSIGAEPPQLSAGNRLRKDFAKSQKARFPDHHVCNIARYGRFLDVVWVAPSVKKPLGGGVLIHSSDGAVPVQQKRTNLKDPDTSRLLLFDSADFSVSFFYRVGAQLYARHIVSLWSRQGIVLPKWGLVVVSDPENNDPPRIPKFRYNQFAHNLNLNGGNVLNRQIRN